MIIKNIKLIAVALFLILGLQVGAKEVIDNYQEAYEGKSKAYIKASENYASYLQRTISKEWQPPKVKGNLETAVYFEIARDGTVSNLEIRESNAPEIYEKDCLRTIAKLSPFKPLPAELGDTYYFEFTFNLKRNWK